MRMKSLVRYANFIQRSCHMIGLAGSLLGYGRSYSCSRQTANRRPIHTDNFQRSSHTHLHAVGTGLNITAANHVIHYNLEWNPAVEDQATARAFRRGQTKPVTVQRLFHIGTVEEIIDERMERKRSIAGHAVIGTEGEIDDIADIMRALELSPILYEGDKNAH